MYQPGLCMTISDLLLTPRFRLDVEDELKRRLRFFIISTTTTSVSTTEPPITTTMMMPVVPKLPLDELGLAVVDWVLVLVAENEV